MHPFRFFLFKFITTPDKEVTLLEIPEICADKIITLNHSSLFAGHQGVVKTYLAIGHKFFIPGSCIICVHSSRDVIYVSWQEKTNHHKDSYRHGNT